MEIISGIYSIKNIQNHHQYIGSSHNVDRRWCEHLRLLRANKHHAPHLQRAFNKYGENNFIFQILMPCMPKDCIYYEQEFMDYFLPKYNVCKKAGSRLGTIGPNKGKKFSDEYRHKLSISHLGQSAWNRGKKCSLETRNKISAIQRGKTISIETRLKISKAMQGRKINKSWRKKLSIAQTGKKYSKEIKKKISDASKKQWKSFRKNHPKGRMCK